MAYGSSEASGSRAGDGSTGSGSGAAAAGGRRPGPKEAKTVRPSGHPARHISFDEAERPEATEASPLLSRDGVNEHSSSSSSSSADSECEVEVVQREEAFHETKSLWYLILLTIGMFGVQISWSVELSYGTPYLVSLGLSKSVMALVWIAGPLSGTLVQPYVGMLSDRCRLRWGKRKPFMIGGTIATVLSLLNLGWTKEIVGGFLGLFGFDPASNVVHVSICAVAVLWIYVLDFAINTVQASVRAFIVDCSPPHQQEAVNSMASRFLGVGNIIGYAAGYINLTRYLWFLGDTQFKDLCAFGSIALASSILLSVLTIRERDPRLEGPPPADRPGVFNFFGKVFTSIKRLPPQTRKVCIIQFFSWIGFFPLIFYTSEYIAEMYVDPLLRENPNMSDEELDRLYELATRVGTFALLMNAVASFLTNLLLPFFVEPTYDTKPVFDEEPNGSPVANGKDYDDDETQTFLSRLVIPGFTLRRAWMLALILYSLVIFCTVIVRSVSAATVLIGLTGISWALALWAPWAIIAAEISRLDAVRRARKAAQERLAIGDGSGNGIDETLDGDISSLPVQPQSGAGPSGPAGDDLGGAGGDGSSGSINRSKGPAAVATEEVNDDEPDQAGVVLGIHNMAIAAPQMISTFISSIIFRLFQKPRNVPGDRSIAMTLALGGFTVLVAAWFVHTLRDEVATVPADLLAAAEDGDSEVLIVSTGSLRGAGSSSPAAGENVLASSVLSTASRASRSRRQSSEAQRRRSMERATLARSSSFGSGLEY